MGRDACPPSEITPLSSIPASVISSQHGVRVRVGVGVGRTGEGREGEVVSALGQNFLVTSPCWLSHTGLGLGDPDSQAFVGADGTHSHVGLEGLF